MTPSRLLLAAALALSVGAPGSVLLAQGTNEPATLAIAYPRDPSLPIPTLWSGDIANQEVSDLIFLRLADVGPEVVTSGDKGFIPRLARKWERRDPLTLVFELDPRARWQDGKPVTSADVVFGFERARNPKLSPRTAPLLQRVQSVTAEGDRRVVVKFTERYPAQLYDATFHAPPLPAHLLSKIVPESLATSSFASQPIGNGPYRWVRRTPGQLVELAADPRFFLGKPRITRVLFLIAPDPEARANLVLSGTADAIDNIYSFTNPARLERLPAYQYYPVPGLTLIYINLNQRDPADSSRPHPILSDPVVRQALVQAADRATIAKSVYGSFTISPAAPVSSLLARSVDAPPSPPYDTVAAIKLLEARGWIDHDGDGVRDKDGRPLSFGILVPAPTAARQVMATRLQEAYRQLGIQLQIDILDGSVFTERHFAGKFDMDFWGASQDPAPSGLSTSWSCAGIGGSNVIHYCNRAVDSLLARAAVNEKEAPGLYRDALRRIAADYPALFMAALVATIAVHRRFQNVRLQPTSVWSGIWQWTVAEH